MDETSSTNMADEHPIPDLIPGVEGLNLSADSNNRTPELQQEVQQTTSPTTNEAPENTDNDQARNSREASPPQPDEDASNEATGVENTNEDSATGSHPTRRDASTRAPSPPINQDLSAGILRPCPVCSRCQMTAAQCTYFRTGEPPCGPCARRQFSAAHCQLSSDSYRSLGAGRGAGSGGGGGGGGVVGYYEEIGIGVVHNFDGGGIVLIHRQGFAYRRFGYGGDG